MNAFISRRGWMLVSLVGAAAMQSLAGCSSSSPGSGNDAGGSTGTGGSSTGTGGSSATGSGGATTSGTGGAGTGGAASGTGGSGTGSGGATGSGGMVVTPTDAGMPGPDANPVDMGGTNNDHTCNLVIGVSVTYDWFTSGFESGVDNTRWEGLAPPAAGESFIQNWADPNSPLWSMQKLSACTKNPNSPDRVVFVGVNWDYTTAAQWLAAYDGIIKTLQAKFPALTEIDLDTLIRGPNNMDCGAPTNGLHEVVVQPFIDSAIEMAVAKYNGLVKAAPKLYAPNCNVFATPGPHFTTAGKMVVAKVYSDYYVNHQ